jgi:exodeoxyribonuclease VII small subunit
VAAQRKENGGRSPQRDNESMPRVLFQNQIERMRHAQQLSDIGASTQAAFARRRSTSPAFPSATLCLIPCLPVSSKPKQRETEPNFEGAMDRLEKIVEQMESGKLPLEDLIVRYEEGMNLVKICQERLANAEHKIEIIARDSAGRTTVKEFETTPEPVAPANAVAETENTNDEIKLF